MKNVCIILSLIVEILLTVSCSKDENKDNPIIPQTKKIEFSYEQFTVPDNMLPYRKAEIASSTDGKFALVIYLHGGSSKGTDNTIQLNEKGIDSIGNYLLKNQIKSILLVPQCPTDKTWDGELKAVLKSLIDSYTAKNEVDRQRIYILGGSMGGTGTWSILSAYPNIFAAAMPVAGNPSRCDAGNVATTPVLTVMGTMDKIMSIETVKSFAEQVNALSGNIRLEVEDGWTHEQTCIESYTSERLKKLFEYKRY
mgnify:CR=1 FL=1